MSFGSGEYLIFVFFGVVTAIVARARGRSSIIWGIVGLFLPVIGLIIVALLPADPSSVVENAIGDGKLKRCQAVLKLFRLKPENVGTAERLSVTSRR